MEWRQMDSEQGIREQLKEILGPELEQFSDRVPGMMARELVANDRGFITRFQLSRPLLSRLTPGMQAWTSPDVLRHLLPSSPLSKMRMQPMAGSVAAIHSARFPQFSYYSYIPVSHLLERRKTAPVIALVHGSSRNPAVYRDEFAEFAERHGCFLLAPLFPINLADDVPDEQYKYLVGNGLRYDDVLLSMIEELSVITSTTFDRILLFGFSGGAQFAHRFFYVRPDVLHAVSIAAPGFVTLPWEEHDWWVGLRDLEKVFGVAPRVEEMRRVPVQLLCGADDNIDYEIYSRRELGLGKPEYHAYGRNRVERIGALKRTYDDLGIASRIEFVPDTRHELLPLAGAAKPFFESCLQRGNAQSGDKDA